MAKIVAIEWDAREARFAIGSPKGNEVVVEEAFAIELVSEAESEAPTIAQVKAQMAVALAEKGLAGGDALVAIPRSSIELRTLNLPLAPADEIPDLVRFQAMQAFTSIGEEWPLDFVELESHEDSLNVLATVVSPQLVAQTRDVCEAINLREKCLVLRPFAAVSLLQRFESIDIFRCSLIVDLLPDGADLTAISNGHVVFMRSVRLPATSDRSVHANALLGELRRTIGAAQNQMGVSRIEQIVICGDETEHQTLQETIASALSLDVIHFNPFDAIRLTRTLQADLPEHCGRYAPLLGMLACHGTGTGHTIDFLNPRKRPEPPSQLRRNLVVAVTALTVILVGTFVFLSHKRSLDQQIADQIAESKSMDAAVDKAKYLIVRVDRIQSFEKQDITWLDELRRAAVKLPDADSLILRQVVMGVDPLGAGVIRLHGNVADANKVAELEQALRYGENLVEGSGSLVDESNRDYPYTFTAAVHVPADVLEDGHSRGRPPLKGEFDEDKTRETTPPPSDDGAVTEESTEAVDPVEDESVVSSEDASSEDSPERGRGGHARRAGGSC